MADYDATRELARRESRLELRALISMAIPAGQSCLPCFCAGKMAHMSTPAGLEGDLLRRFAPTTLTHSVDIYRSLALRSAQQVAIAAIDAISPANCRKSECIDLVTRLACFVPGSLQGLHHRLFENEVFYPGVLYRDAAPEVRDALIRRLDSLSRHSTRYAEDGGLRPQLNQVLFCLAWIGDNDVVDLFSRWRMKPPAWQSELNEPVWQVSTCAGWELTDKGTRHELYSPTAYALCTAPTPDDLSSTPLGVFLPHEERCQWCGKPLTTLFEFDLNDSRFSWLGVSGHSLQVATCIRCGCYGDIFTKVDGEGRSAWHPHNVKPPIIGGNGGEWVAPPERALILGQKRRSPYETYLQAWIDVDRSQIGGVGTWWQVEHFPNCPTCGRKMPLIGQIEAEDVQPYTEGTTYAYLCAECGIAATSYQQT